MKNALLIIFLVVVAIVVGFFWQEGLFLPVEVTEDEVGPYQVVYKDHTGAYSQGGPVMNEVYQELFVDGIQTTRGIGIYFDDPRKIAKKDLRSQVGSIVEKDDYINLVGLENKYSIKYISPAMSVVTTFPYKNKLSIMLGVFKVYPKLNKYIEEKGYTQGPIIEIYDKPAKTIYYIMNITD